jgi:hypothetical protein
VVRSGEVLLEGPAFASAREVVANNNRLKAAWADLLASVARKRDSLGLSLKAQQFYFEVGEIEAWIAEKAQTLKGVNSNFLILLSINRLTFLAFCYIFFHKLVILLC